MRRLDHDRVTSLFAQARALPPAGWAAFLDAHCPGDPELRREVEQLLAFDDPAALAFEEAAQQIAQPDPRHIGPYELLEPVGEGGMAVVYRAQQLAPIRRIVAVKLIKLGMDTRQFVARFEAERQTLAMMDHPNVAQVYDAGSTPTGRPYLVMEFVAGRRLLEWCDEHTLSIRQRLQLFIPVCEAVEHAHRKGIIHRDLKDSNVLVCEIDGRAVPKVIDFGIARLIDQPSGDRTRVTEHGQFIGTPAYMSPEQAEHGVARVDTRADVYSLGVLLYELLSGVEPIPSESLRSGSYDEIRKLICQSETPKPATRLSALTGAQATAVAELRGVRSATLLRQLHDELEWIPLKAMRKDREQRYRSAAELADDIRNYLGGRPLIAGPESRAYLVRKFLHRHRAGVATALLIALLLIAGIVATSLQTLRARRAEADSRKAEARAVLERDNARATLEFFTDDVLSNAGPESIHDAAVRDQIVKAMIMPAADRVGESFKDRPVIEASVRAAIQGVLREIGRAELALPHAETALSIRRRELGDDHADTMQSMNDMGRVLRALGRYADAEPVYREAMERRQRVLGPDHIDTLSSLNNYGGILERLGKLSEAEPIFKDVLDRRRRILGEDNSSSILSLNNYAHIVFSLGKTAEAEPLYREALERRRRVNGADHPQTLLAINNYADALIRLGRRVEAEKLARESAEGYLRVLGPDHPATIMALANHAFMLRRLGRAAEAEPMYIQVIEQRRRLLGEAHPDTIYARQQYASALSDWERPLEAEPLARQALADSRRELGLNHPGTLQVQQYYGIILMQLERFDEAEALLKDHLERAKAVLAPSAGPVLGGTAQYAKALVGIGRTAEAEQLMRTNLETAVASPSLGPDHEDTRNMAEDYARCLVSLGRPEDAAAVRRRFGLTDPSTQPSTSPS